MQIGTDSIWHNAPVKRQLARNEVDLWRATVEVSSLYSAGINKLLSSDERAKAARFVFERDRNRFVVARAFLRAILGRYLDCAPSELQFSYADYGKPFLAGPYAHMNLNFNLAHSATMALYGITLGRAIGVDLEQIRPEIDIEEIASRFFSAKEASSLLSIPANDRGGAFFDCWTRKEAFIKAKGAGLSLPLDQFDVTLSPGEPASLLETRWNQDESSRWSLRAIDVGTGYAAAVAVEGLNWHANYWQASKDMLVQSASRAR